MLKLLAHSEISSSRILLWKRADNSTYKKKNNYVASKPQAILKYKNDDNKYVCVYIYASQPYNEAMLIFFLEKKKAE